MQHRSVPLGRMPFADIYPSCGIVVHRLDLNRWASSSHSIRRFCCRSAVLKSHQSQQPQLRISTMAGNVVLLASTCLRSRPEHLGLSHPVACQPCGGRLACSGLRSDHRCFRSHDGGQAYRGICLHRSLQYEWVEVRWNIMAGRPLVDRVSIPRVSIASHITPTLTYL